MRRGGGVARGQLDFRGRPGRRDGGPPVVAASGSGAPGAPTILVYGHYDVQPPGDVAEWQTPAVRARRRRRRDLRRGRHRRQGPGASSCSRWRRRSSAGGRAAAQRQVPPRGRGGDRQPPASPAYVREHRDELAADLVDLRRRRDVAPERAVAVDRRQGLVDARHRRHRRGRGPALGPLRRHRREPRARAARDPGRPAHGRRAGRGRRLLRRMSRAERRAPGGHRGGALRRGGLPGGGRPRALFGEAGYTHARAALGAADARGQRGRGPAASTPSSRTSRPGARLLPAGAGPAPGRRARGDRPATSQRSDPRRPRPVRPDAAGVPAYTIPADHPAIRPPLARRSTRLPEREPLLVRSSPGRCRPRPAVRGGARLEDALLLLLHGDENLHAPNEFFRLARLREGQEAWRHLLELLAAS